MPRKPPAAPPPALSVLVPPGSPTGAYLRRVAFYGAFKRDVGVEQGRRFEGAGVVLREHVAEVLNAIERADAKTILGRQSAGEAAVQALEERLGVWGRRPAEEYVKQARAAREPGEDE